MSLRIAYMTGEYLQVSPFVFVYREIAALRRLGVHIETISVRDAPESSLVSDEQRAERAQTYMLFPYSPLKLIAVHGRLLFTAPGRYLRAVGLAMRTRPPGIAAFFKQLNYFFQAGLVATRVKSRNLTHLHNHFADSSCTVAMLAAELGGFTFSFTIHGPSIFFHPRMWRIDEKGARAAFMFCISHFCRSQARIFVPLEHWDRMHIIHCGIEPAEFQPKTRAGHGQRLLFTGRLAAVKGLPILFQALQELKEEFPGVELTLIGDGPDRAYLEDYARELGLKDTIIFAGYQSLEQVRARLAEADIFVLPSFAEGVPVVLMEAMAAGLPVVATRVAGVPELVHDGESGYVVTPGDPVPLAARLRELLRDNDLRKRFGVAGRKMVEQEFNIDREAEKIRSHLIRLHDFEPSA